MPLRDSPPAPSRRIQVGLIGAGIQLSKSPALHMREAALHGLDYSYELFDLAQRGLTPAALPSLLAEAESRGFSGVNVTHPCKQLVLPLLTQLSPDAAAIGAVNTVTFQGGERTGYNTDWSGFYESFERNMPDVPRRKVLLLGAGGAGVAVAHAALKANVRHLFISDIDRQRAEQLCRQLNLRFGEHRASPRTDIDAAMTEVDGLIHATPTGMPHHPGLPINADMLSPRHWVAEIVYVPLATALVTLARRRGCKVLDGGGMAVFQAIGALRLFAGIEPDAQRMTRHFDQLSS